MGSILAFNINLYYKTYIYYDAICLHTDRCFLTKNSYLSMIIL